MELNDLFAVVLQDVEVKAGLDLVRDQMKDSTRRALSEVLAGRLMVAFSDGVLSKYRLGSERANVARSVAEGLLCVVGLAALNGVNAQDVENALAELS